MKDYKKDFNDKLEDGSFCDGELISIANGYITEMQNIITELEKDKQYFSDSLDKQIESTLKLHKEYQELEQKNHEILKNSLDISNRFDELEEKLANADYQLEGRDITIKELEAQIEKMLHTFLDLLWFEENLDPYMYECNSAQKGELLKPFDNARLFLEKYKCKKCKGEGTIRVGYNGWDKNPCPTCKGKGYVFRR